MEKTKVHLNEIEEVEVTTKVKAWKINGQVISKMGYANKEQLATHRDCEECGVEFEKQFTFEKYCKSCSFNKSKEKYNSLELVEWNGEDALQLYHSDEYFFDYESIVDYAEENDLNIEDLDLVLCQKSTFSLLEYDFWQDDTHEDWEPEKELEDLVTKLNEYLKSASTNTWFPTNKRVSICIEKGEEKNI